MKFRWPWQKSDSEQRSVLDVEGLSAAAPDYHLLEMLGGGQSLAGETVSQGTAMGETSIGFCINIIAEDIASMDTITYYDDGFSRDQAVNHPLYSLLRYRANEWQTAVEWKLMAQRHLGGWGAHYSFITRDDNMVPRELVPLMPDRTWPERRPGGRTVFVTQMDSGQIIEIPYADVLYISWFTQDGLTPLSPIQQFREMLGRDVAANRFMSRFYSQGAQLKGYIKVPEGIDVKNPDPSARAVGNGLRRQRQPVPHGAPRAGMEYIQVGVNPRDAQFVESSNYSSAQVASILRVPTVMLNRLERATWGNTQDLLRYYVKNTLGPWRKRWEQAIYSRLMTQGQRRRMVALFDTSEILKGDPESEANRHIAYANAGILAGNEIRREIGYNPVAGLEKPFEPNAQMVPAGQEDEPADEPDDQDNERLLSLANHLVRNVVQLDVATVRKLAGKPDKLNDYFAGHGKRLQRMLSVPAAVGDEHGLRCMRDINGATDVESVISRWEKELPEALLRAIIHGRTGT